jgi:hypothetical protein
LNINNHGSYMENINYSFLNFINRVRNRQTEELRTFFQNNIFEITSTQKDPYEDFIEDSKEHDELYKLNMIEESLNNIEFDNIYKVYDDLT